MGLNNERVSSAAVAATSCRVAIVGAGSMAREHLRAFADVPGVVLSGIHSRTRARASALAEEFGLQMACDSIEELFEKTAADLVIVTVPELSMNSVSRACFAFPWTVLLEKPAGYNLTDAEDIASAARAAQSRVFVALNRRAYSSTQTALNDLAQIADRRYIRIQDQQDQGAALASGQPATVVENWMYANSVHTIDYFRVFGRGPIDEVRPISPWNPERPGVVISEIRFASGDLGVYEGIWNGPGPWAATISTPPRRWEMRPLEQAMYQNRGERTLHPVDVDASDTRFKAGFRRQAELAVTASLGREAPGLATIDDALETMRLVNRIFE